MDGWVEGKGGVSKATRNTPACLRRPDWMYLTGVIDDLVDDVALLLVVVGADLEGEGELAVVVVGAGDNVEVDAGGLGGEDAGAAALLAEVDLGAVELVEHDGGQGAEHLQREVGRLDHVHRRHQRVHHQRQPRRVLDRHRVRLALDDHRRVAAPADQDRVRHRRLDLDRLRVLLVVLLNFGGKGKKWKLACELC